MKKDIRLDRISDIPAKLLNELSSYSELLRCKNYMEELIEHQPIKNIATQLEQFVMENNVLGYHCTKEPESGFFIKNGLRVLERKTHQEEFLEKFGGRFSPEQIEQIKLAWNSYFDKMQDNGRNGKIWFCMSPYLVIEDGTEYFFEYFGGEAIYMPIADIPFIDDMLRKIGNPVVVEVRLVPNELRKFHDLGFSLDLLSHYHKTVNPEAYIHSLEGKITRNILSNEVVRVYEKNQFFKLFSS